MPGRRKLLVLCVVCGFQESAKAHDSWGTILDIWDLKTDLLFHIRQLASTSDFSQSSKSLGENWVDSVG